MPADTLESPETEAPTSFDLMMDRAMQGGEEDEYPTIVPPVTVAPPEVTQVERPEPPEKETTEPEHTDDKTPAGKPSRFKALSQEKDREREEALTKQKEELAAEYEAKLAEATAAKDQTAKSYEDRLAATEALKATHEAKARELEEQIVQNYEAPYSVSVDPEALPVLSEYHRATQAMNAAVAQAATGLHDDPSAVSTIAEAKDLFAGIMFKMTQMLSPDSTHAKALADGLSQMGVHVTLEDARDAIRGLKASLPHITTIGESVKSLRYIEDKNRPNWTRDQSARHEAYRRKIAAAADVPEDAAEGDEAVLSGILKANPELRTVLKEEMEKVSLSITGPPPGRANAAAIKAAPAALHETAMRAARVPVLIRAVQAAQETISAREARIAELEARIEDQSGAVPRPGGVAAPGQAPDTGPKRSFSERVDELFA